MAALHGEIAGYCGHCTTSVFPIGKTLCVIITFPLLIPKKKYINVIPNFTETVTYITKSHYGAQAQSNTYYINYKYNLL